MSGKPATDSITTVGLPNYFVSYRLTDGSLVNIQIMDTAGQERFKSINTSYYRKADCCLLVYDISDRYSFDQLKDYFIETIKEKCKKNIQIVLLGNKTDLEEKRQIPSEEGANLALLNNYIFLETSCLKNKNVADAFETLIEITNREAKKAINENNSNNISLTNEKKHKNDKNCSCKIFK